MNMILLALIQQGYEVSFTYDESADFSYTATATRKGRTQVQGSTLSVEDALQALLRYMLSNLSLAHDNEDRRFKENVTLST